MNQLKRAYEGDLVVVWAVTDQAGVVCEDALVASAPPRGEEPLCTLTIHADSIDGPSDHWPSQAFVAVVSMLLLAKTC